MPFQAGLHNPKHSGFGSASAEAISQNDALNNSPAIPILRTLSLLPKDFPRASFHPPCSEIELTSLFAKSDTDHRAAPPCHSLTVGNKTSTIIHCGAPHACAKRSATYRSATWTGPRQNEESRFLGQKGFIMRNQGLDTPLQAPKRVPPVKVGGAAALSSRPRAGSGR
jgi:hypothetical protein